MGGVIPAFCAKVCFREKFIELLLNFCDNDEVAMDETQVNS
jgi:hypothetical protein